MKKPFAVLCLFSLIVLSVSPAWGNMVIDFDDLSVPSIDYDLPSLYQGLTWDGDWELTNNTAYRSRYRNSFDFPSNPNAAYNDYNDMTDYSSYLSVSSGSAIKLTSGSFAGWTRRDSHAHWSADSLTINAYQNGLLVDSVSFDLDPGQLVRQSIDLTGDKFEFVQHGHGINQWWLVDNLEWDSGGNASPVPVPSTMILFASGIICFIGLRAKKAR
jgi:hypothetical protein